MRNGGKSGLHGWTLGAYFGQGLLDEESVFGVKVFGLGNLAVLDQIGEWRVCD